MHQFIDYYYHHDQIFSYKERDLYRTSYPIKLSIDVNGKQRRCIIVNDKMYT
jgi:hypothetical protein